MPVRALGYVGIDARDFEPWRAFGTDVLAMQIVERYVPIRPMKVTLRASHATGAPIHAIAMQMAGTYYSVEGVVDFEPKASGRYAVKGELKKEGSSVWIEDVTTGQPVTVKITKP